jgi:UDP-N-acetylglucosamine 2-epimerase (non-hydrolysing)
MILIAFGTRPEYIKIKPLLEVFKKESFANFKTLFTGQHEHIIGSKVNFDYKIKIEDGDNRLDSIFTSILNKQQIFDGITHVLVQGDTASAYAVALAAFHRRIPVIHLEAGLRTYDIENPYPEEYYRRCISNLASINLCVSDINEANLINERTPGQKFVVGNTVLDNLKGIQTKYDKKILVTLHRRENHEMIKKWFEKIEDLANKYSDYEFLLPIHPNPSVKKYSHILQKVKVCEPLEHEELIKYLADCAFIITDSGGLQEESAFLKKKSIVCRKFTERVEGLGTFSFLCKEPKDLKQMVDTFITSYEINKPCPYGDGNSSEKIYDIIKSII